MKIVVFDFCNTLVNLSTADGFAIYAIERLEIPTSKKILAILKSIDKKTCSRFRLYKKMLLWYLKFNTRSKMEKVAYEYYSEYIRPHLNLYIIQELIKYKNSGWKVYVVSGGYDIYLRYFADEYYVDKLIASRLCFMKNIFLGVIKGHDCMGKQKVKLLESKIKTIIEEKVVFTDSKSDLPLLKWADKGIVVSNTQHRSWVRENGFEEIVLSEVI